MKVLHVVSSLNPGGIEKWLFDFSTVNSDFSYHILKQTSSDNFFDDPIRENGVNISSIEKTSTITFLFLFAKFLKKNKFDIIHLHVHYSSGILALISKLVGIKVRVVHSHLAMPYQTLPFRKKIYRKLMRYLIGLTCSDFIAVSDKAADDLIPSDSYSEIPCGIRLVKYNTRNSTLDSSVFTVGHVGRFSIEKNHEFMFKIIKACKSRGLNFRFKFVGEGVLKGQFIENCEAHGLSSMVEFLKPTNSVDQHMLNDFDIFIFPSTFEGLGLALIEAQYYGLPCIASTHIPNAALFEGVITHPVLDRDVDAWVNYLVDISCNNFKANSKAKEEILISNFNIDNNVKLIESLYREAFYEKC